MANFPELTSALSDGDSVQVPGLSTRHAVNERLHDGMKPLGDEVRPRVSVVIVTYGSSKEIPDCVESLRRQSVPIEIFLVDNASPDNTAEMVSDYAARFQNVRAILNKENVGLAAGNNTPMEQCRGEYLLMLNPDTMFRNDSLQHMVEFLDHNRDVGVVGPKNVYENGEPHVSFERHWGLRQVLMWRVLPYRFPRLLHDRFSSYETQDVLFVSGSCLLIRRNIFEQIGGYDPEFFLAIEDVCDLCLRVKQSGSRVVFLADQEVVHLTARSCVQAPYIVVWQGNRGTVYYFWKQKGIFQALVVSILLLMAAAARVVTGAILGIAKKRYRTVARIYARVFWGLLVRSPIRANR